MFKQTCTNLTTLPKQRVRQWLSSFETFLFDADGVLWHFNKPIDGSVEVFNLLRSLGKNNFIVTNNSSLTGENMLKKAKNLGFEIEQSNILTAALSVANYLSTKKFQKKAYIIGDAAINDELANLNICSFSIKPEKMNKPMHVFAREMSLDPGVGAVVVAKDDGFNVPTMIRACSYLQNRRTLFLGTCMDTAYPIGDKRMIVGAGAMIAAIKTISGRTPLILGKPNPWMLREPISCGQINPETTLLIGDTLQSDMVFAHNNGVQSMLVGTGVNSTKDVEKIQNGGNEKLMVMVPDTYLPHLGHLHDLLC